MKNSLLCILTVLLFASLAHADLWCYWHFDEGAGANVADTGPSGFAATTTGGVTWGNGMSGQALQFDGSSGLIRFPLEMSMSGSSYSAALWFNTTSTANGVLVQQRTTGSIDGQYTLRIEGGVLYFWTYRGGYGFNFGTTGRTFNDGQWHHVVATAENGVGRIYVDGGLIASGSGAVKELNNTLQMGMGCDIRDTNKFYGGRIDEFMLFNHTLTPAEVKKAAWPQNGALISPANGETPVSINPTLVWAPPMLGTPTGYDVAVGTDPNIVSPVFTVNNLNALSVAPGTLEFSTTYYWRVDTRVGATVYPGKPFRFTTAGPEPVVKEQPVPTTVPAGTTAMLSTTVLNAVAWKWYSQDDPETVLSTEATLALADMSLDKEGFYYCIAQNGVGAQVSTNAVRVMVARQIAQWGFENDLTDTVADWDGAYVDPNATDEIVPEPVFATGVAGQAIQLTGDGAYVNIPGSESFFNFHDAGLTVSVWMNPKVPHEYTGGWYGVVLKDGAGGWTLRDKNTTYGGGVNFGLPGLSLETSGRTDTGEWQLYTFTYDAVAGVLKLYRDGVFASQKEGTFLGGSTGTIHIGAVNTGTGNNFRGLLDEVQVWNYPLDKFEVAHLYADVKGVSMCVDSVTGLEFDLNSDCRIDLLDFAQICENWLACNLVPTCYP